MAPESNPPPRRDTLLIQNERRRIARDLHDDLGQQVTALRLTLEQLATDPATEPLRQRIVQLQESAAHLDMSLHQVSVGLRPAALDLGIVPAVRQLAGEWSASSGIAVSLHADDIDRSWLEPDVETHVFRILQEALTNAAKHAAATRVSVVLNRLADGVSLTIVDNGGGFDVEAVLAAQRGIGLVGMRERVQLIGGRLDIRSTDSQGTVVSLTAPRSAVPPPD
jgi:two-component system, NarL family, sensor histidine kinase NreB